MTISSYKHLGGKHPETATIRNVLAALGVKAPHTGKPFSEEMLFGIGGGLGIGYILWEFKKYESAILAMAFQNKWNYPVKFTSNLCKRLGITPVFKETGGQGLGEQQLKDALRAGIPAIAWVDHAHLPYWFLPEHYKGCWGWIVNVYGYDEEQNTFTIDDLGKRAFTLTRAELVATRGRIPSYKNRLLLLSPPEQIDLAGAIKAGLQDCVDYLGAKSDSFALPAIEKWAKLMTDTKNKKGWPVVFKQRRGLFSTLCSIYEGIELRDTGGGGMRGMYADFLTEADTVLKQPPLKKVAKQYRKLGQQWSALAESCLPDNIKPFKDTKALLVQKYDLLRTQGDNGLREVAKLSTKLDALEHKCEKDFPLDDSKVAALFSNLQSRLFEIYYAEEEALAKLRESLRMVEQLE
ncbi:DUF4872 domain-containing protein [candidate division KSB1 bacterium]|nr:DUF4872 domain-containing protein [candidate division KSB1 bacterium]